MNFPDNLKYTKEHEWIKVDGDTAIVGITEHATEELGDIVYLEIDTEGDTLDQGDTFGTVEAVKTVSDLFMPVGGEVAEINEKLEDKPEIVNEDPYGEGWLIKIKMSDASEVDGLMSAEDYKGII